MSKKTVKKTYVHSPLTPLVRALLVLLLLAVISVTLYAYHVGMWRHAAHLWRYFFAPKRLEALIASYGPFAGVVFVALQALQVIIAPIPGPGEITGFVSGFLFGHVRGAILSTLGLTLGSLIAFLIARIFGVPLVEKAVKKEYRERFHEFVASKGLYLVFALYLTPGVPKDPLCYLLGLTGMGFVPFILISIFGRLPGTLILTWQGAAVSHQHYKTFFFLLAGSLLLTVVLYLTRDGFTKSFTSLIRRVFKNKEGEEKPLTPAGWADGRLHHVRISVESVGVSGPRDK